MLIPGFEEGNALARERLHHEMYPQNYRPDHHIFTNFHHNFCEYGSLRGNRHSEGEPRVIQTSSTEQNVLDTVQRNLSTRVRTVAAAPKKSILHDIQVSPLQHSHTSKFIAAIAGNSSGAKSLEGPSGESPFFVRTFSTENMLMGGHTTILFGVFQRTPFTPRFSGPLRGSPSLGHGHALQRALRVHPETTLLARRSLSLIPSQAGKGCGLDEQTIPAPQDILFPIVAPTPLERFDG
ncbi:hypothetical protein TNCV_864381 [Trichonephila clavipes]|nr:hypothetical protein TNCV_864381 [Trichonephila clavipes]